MKVKQKGRQRHAGGRAAARSVETEFSALSELSIGDLKSSWTGRFNSNPPAVRSCPLLLRLFAWQIQANAAGGLDAITTRRLGSIAKALERDGTYEPKIRSNLSAGVVLTREWKGVVHKVTVTSGGFQHLGKRYGSLSDIARTITGTRWSGPRFFGLEQKRARPLQEVRT
jgi:hypothetical protein